MDFLYQLEIKYFMEKCTTIKIRFDSRILQLMLFEIRQNILLCFTIIIMTTKKYCIIYYK